MQINKKIKEIYQKLPYGSKKIISKTTGLSAKTVYNCLDGKSCSFNTITKISKAVIKISKSFEDL